MTDSAPDRPTVAGRYDFYLGGTGHTPADRAAAEQIVQILPEIVDAAWANRGFRLIDRSRSRTEIERFFAGLELVAPYPGAGPDLAYVGMWGAEDPAAADSEGSRLGFAAVARKP